jgi:stage III sporulation protein AG
MMGEKQKKETGRLGHKWLLLLLSALGIALILIGNGDWLAGRKEEKDTTSAQADPLAAYATSTEQKIAALCESIRGVDQVTVVVTLEGDFTYIYATDTESSERDGVVEKHTEYVTIGSGTNEQTVLLTREYPRVSGIGIVCRGGGDATVRREILSLLSATYGIPTNQIYIAEAKE